jgi:two-component system alkaline phosphatase synthesis response regulator PhoP
MGFRRTVVLVVSDDTEETERMQQLLGTAGYIPVALADGWSVLESAKSIRPDIVLLDMNLKGRNALNAARSLKGHPDTDDMPILLAGNCPDGKNRWRASLPHIDSWVSKPFSQKDVIMAIEKILYKRMVGADIQNYYRHAYA